MITDNGGGLDDRTADREQSATTEASRRQALGRLAKYTAPAMVALLLSEQSAVASFAP